MEPIIVNEDLFTRCGISSVVCPSVITVAGYEGCLPLVRKGVCCHLSAMRPLPSLLPHRSADTQPAP